LVKDVEQAGSLTSRSRRLKKHLFLAVRIVSRIWRPNDEP